METNFQYHVPHPSSFHKKGNQDQSVCVVGAVEQIVEQTMLKLWKCHSWDQGRLVCFQRSCKCSCGAQSMPRVCFICQGKSKCQAFWQKCAVRGKAATSDPRDRANITNLSESAGALDHYFRFTAHGLGFPHHWGWQKAKLHLASLQ